MTKNSGLAHAQVEGSFAWLLRAVNWQRLATVGLVTLLLSLDAMVSPALLDFFSPPEIALAWAEHLFELATIAAMLLTAFALLDRALPRDMPLRVAAIGVLLLALSVGLSVLLHVYYAGGIDHLPPMLRMVADSLRWGLPAVFLVVIGNMHRRALQADSAARAAELVRAQLQQGESERQLALLQAQIEPHFLFNILGNVRRLYRTRPRAGAEAVGSLMHYLRTALPQLRSQRASLGDETAVVQAYLDLFKLRMGAQLNITIEIAPGLHDVEFPPMLLMTLVENAMKHGLEPVGGGLIMVRARRSRNGLEVTVTDDGAGFGATASGGTGVGIVNVRRQLAARYGDRGRLTLEGRQPRGARATIVIPLRDAWDDDPAAVNAAST